MRTTFAKYLVARLVLLAMTLLIVSFAVFSLLYLAPGSAEQALVGDRPVTAEALEVIRARYHLDDPFLTQYASWLEHAARLDLGRSMQTSEPVWSMITQRAPITLLLGILGFVLVMGVGVPLGIVAAFAAGTRRDRLISGASVVGMSAPAFASGIALIYVFAALLGWFPAFGPGEGTADRLRHLLLPAIALAVTAMGVVVKLTRAGMLDVLDQDYVLFARARGVPRRMVTVSYAIRNGLIPVATAGGLILTYMLTGAVFVEIVFALPGMGTTLVDAVITKDFPVLQGVALFVCLVAVSVNLVVEMLYLTLDPRIRSHRGLA